MFSLALTPLLPQGAGETLTLAVLKSTSALNLLILTPSLTCLIMVDLKDPNNFRENSTF